MKLDQDCVRDLLLAIEQNVNLNEIVSLLTLKESQYLISYETSTVMYSALKLIEVEYINGYTQRGDNKIIDVKIASLSWEGHHFLDNIRDPKIWGETKGLASKVTSASLSILNTVAESLIKKQLGI
jgi:hypothetical protein